MSEWKKVKLGDICEIKYVRYLVPDTLPGITIGDNVTIGAGSVVVKDIPSNCIAVGNPCRVVKTI